MRNAATILGPPSSELSLEMQALIRGLRGQAPEDSLLDWAAVCRLAWAHGVAPLLHRTWSSWPDQVPPAVLFDLGELRRRSRKQALLGVRQRDEVLHLLTDNGVQSLILKGGAWSRLWYGDVSLRPFNDVDLLLTVEDIPRAREALLAAGYEEISSDRTPQHDRPLLHPQKPLSVELHRCLVALPASHQLRYDDVAARAITLQDRGTAIPTLDAEDTLLHLCMHVLQHIESEPGWRLLNVWDIVRHTETCRIRWEVFAERAQDNGIAAACRAALGLVSLLTDAEIPADQCDVAAGRHLVSFPFMRHSATPVIHRSALTLLDILSQPRQWRTWPRSVRAALRRRSDSVGSTPAAPAFVAGRQGRNVLTYMSQEMWWLFCELRRLRSGQIAQGIRQLRWEEQARNTVYDLVRQPDSNHDVLRNEESVWSARP